MKHVPTVLTLVGQRIYIIDWIVISHFVSLSLSLPFRHLFGPSTDPDPEKCMGVDLAMPLPLPPLVVVMMNYCFLFFIFHDELLLPDWGKRNSKLSIACGF